MTISLWLNFPFPVIYSSLESHKSSYISEAKQDSGEVTAWDRGGKNMILPCTRMSRTTLVETTRETRNKSSIQTLLISTISTFIDEKHPPVQQYYRKIKMRQNSFKRSHNYCTFSPPKLLYSLLSWQVCSNTMGTPQKRESFPFLHIMLICYPINFYHPM